MMKLRLFVLALLFVSISLLIVPDLTHSAVLGQADKSFKGTTAPFIPPSSSERLNSIPGNNFEFDEEEVEVDESEEGELDRDELPVLTKQERDEFLMDNTDAFESDRLTVLSQEEEETIDEEDIDPISSIVEEIVKNETIIGDEEFVPSPEASIIKFKDQDLEQILDAQEVAPEPDNQTISTTEEEGEDLPLNVTEDDFEIEQADEISESVSPDVDVQSFINETANDTTAPTDNETTITTEDETVEEETTSPTDNETTITTEDETVEEETTAPTDNETTITTEDETVEEETQTPPVVEEEEEEELEQQTEEDEAQTPPVEDESSNTEPIAQDNSVTTSQNQQLNIQLNANDADGDNLFFTIVDEPSNGELGNVDPSTNTVIYTPDEDYSGVDNFTFIVNDGTIDSNEATVSITVEEEEQQTEEDQQEENEDSQDEDEN